MIAPNSPAEFSPLEKLREDLGSRPVRESLEPVRSQSERILGPDRPDRVVQVVGSNGKGSVVHYLENLLTGTDLRTVSYVSPHLNELRERIHLNGNPLESDRFADLIESLSTRVHHDFTPFERLYLATVKLAVEEEVDLMILEAGMGGRWDATSAQPADWTVLTSVDREHTQFLGDTREQILREQLEQVPSGTRLLTPNLEDPGLSGLLKERSEERNLTLVRIEDDGDVDSLNRHLGLTLARILSDVRTRTLREQLRDVGRPPGRKEIVRAQDRTVILDVAHTPAALGEWIRFTRSRNDEHGSPLYLYGSLKGKELEDLTDVLRTEIPSEDLILTRPPSPRGLPPEELARYWTEANESPPAVEPDPHRAWNRLIQRTNSERTLSVAGSFKLISYLKDEVL